MPDHTIWELTIYDQHGEVQARASQKPNGPPVVTGLMNALAEALPSITSLTRFFTDPEDRARTIYETFRLGCAETYGLHAAEWDTIAETDPSLADKWRDIARASSASDPSLN